MARDYFFSFEKYAYVTGQKPEPCILCLIRDRSPEVVDVTVYRDDLFVASVNLYPYNPGHLLIFPNRHIVDVREYTPEEERRLDRLVRYLLDLSDVIHRPAGFNLGYNMGPPAGASIEHLHMHLIPRYPNELGIADLIAGKRVLVEAPEDTARRIRERIDQVPFSSSSS